MLVNESNLTCLKAVLRTVGCVAGLLELFYHYISLVGRDAVGSTDGNANLLWEDIAAVFALDLHWKTECNASYADVPAGILRYWSWVLTSICSNDN